MTALISQFSVLDLHLAWHRGPVTSLLPFATSVSACLTFCILELLALRAQHVLSVACDVSGLLLWLIVWRHCWHLAAALFDSMNFRSPACYHYLFFYLFLDKICKQYAVSPLFCPRCHVGLAKFCMRPRVEWTAAAAWDADARTRVVVEGRRAMPTPVGAAAVSHPLLALVTSIFACCSRRTPSAFSFRVGSQLTLAQRSVAYINCRLGTTLVVIVYVCTLTCMRTHSPCGLTATFLSIHWLVPLTSKL